MTNYKKLLSDLDLVLELTVIKEKGAVFNTLEKLRVPLADAALMQAELNEYEILTREIDIVINGENAAEQASLVDILAQLKREHDIRLLGGMTVEQLIEPVKVSGPGVRLTGLPITRAGPSLTDVFTLDQSVALVEMFELLKDNYDKPFQEVPDAEDNYPGEDAYVSLEKGLPHVDEVPEDEILYDSLAKSNDPLELIKDKKIVDGDNIIPDDFKYLAIDSSGAVHAYVYKPVPVVRFNHWENSAPNPPGTPHPRYITRIDPNKIGDWTKCITAINIDVDDLKFGVFSADDLENPIMWSDIADVYKFAAIDKDGRLSVFTHKPTAFTDTWFIKQGDAPQRIPGIGGRQATHKKLNREFPNWKDTLLERPKTKHDPLGLINERHKI